MRQTDSGLYLWKEQEFKIVQKKYDPPKNEKESGSYFFNYFEFLLLSEAAVCQSQLIFLDSPFTWGEQYLRRVVMERSGTGGEWTGGEPALLQYLSPLIPLSSASALLWYSPVPLSSSTALIWSRSHLVLLSSGTAFLRYHSPPVPLSSGEALLEEQYLGRTVMEETVSIWGHCHICFD